MDERIFSKKNNEKKIVIFSAWDLKIDLKLHATTELVGGIGKKHCSTSTIYVFSFASIRLGHWILSRLLCVQCTLSRIRLCILSTTFNSRLPWPDLLITRLYFALLFIFYASCYRHSKHNQIYFCIHMLLVWLPLVLLESRIRFAVFTFAFAFAIYIFISRKNCARNWCRWMLTTNWSQRNRCIIKKCFVSRCLLMPTVKKPKH